MKRFLVIFLLLFGVAGRLMATNQRAGEITFKYISPLTYEVTIVTYSYAPSPADRFELELKWGDGTSTVLARNNGPLNQFGLHLGEIVGTDIKRNLYTGTHTYAGAATYKLSLDDPNRNYGIVNIPNSVEIPFYTETQLVINPFVGINSSPQLLLPPIDKGCVGQPFIHNPGAYDPDGDSLSFVLTTCRGANGEKIPGFQLPNQVGANAGGSFSINPTTGEIRWDKPEMQGEYNIAFLIEEWRNGIKIGYITRDMQITIVTCDDHAPVIEPLKDTCVEAGKTLQIKLSAGDIDFDKIRLTATGEPFQVANKASFVAEMDSSGHNTGVFTWQTDCSNIRKNSSKVYIKATDDASPVNLFDLKSFNVKVIGPAPENLVAKPLGNTIKLTWNANKCSNVSGYKIYRRNGNYGFNHGYCETGVPFYTGYQLVSTLTSPVTSFIDNDLSRGLEYCYMVVALFPDGAESYASNEACAQLKKDVPVITNVSITQTGTTDGKVYIAWSKPTELDISQAPGPYKYLIYRSMDINGSAFTLIDSLASLNDTIYFDNNINTADQGVSYRIDLYNDLPSSRFLIGPSQKASSVFLTCDPGDKKIRINFTFLVPWTNEHYIVYRKNETTQLFDSIATTIQPFFVDKELVNGEKYCYKVLAIGSFGTSGITDPLLNYSQEVCASPIDNEAPCAPKLSVTPDCDHFANRLTWENTDPLCSSDINRYLIYYKGPENSAPVLIDSTTALTYLHAVPKAIAGCYSIIAIDNAGNKSQGSDTVCVPGDACGVYRLPNVFTPNGDEQNDFFKPFPYSSVEKIDLKIFNRWGRVIFTTQDPDIKWDGKIMNTNDSAADGVYYYVCDVYEISIAGTVKRTIKGSITILH